VSSTARAPAVPQKLFASSAESTKFSQRVLVVVDAATVQPRRPWGEFLSSLDHETGT
jgi:hypothetical protein